MNDQNHIQNPDNGNNELDDQHLDTLLRSWHEQSADRARKHLDAVFARVTETKPVNESEPDGVVTAPSGPDRPRLIRRILMSRYTRIAAAIALVAVIVPVWLPEMEREAQAIGDIVMTPEAGRLDAMDEEGNVIGPCPLRHTDVKVEASGPFLRVTLTQSYYNPYPDKIEAVYTFPLSHRAAVDRMTMTVGDRVTVGEVHESTIARAIYQAARERGYVASLLEQERPNIFTQSVANIESGAEVDIEISYVELLEQKDGEYSFAFPMVVGPRYIPGKPKSVPATARSDFENRLGVTLLGPAKLTITEVADAGGEESDEMVSTTQPAGEDPSRYNRVLNGGNLHALVHHSVPINRQVAAEREFICRFEAEYHTGAKEFGAIFADGTGVINGRWFYVGDIRTARQGEGAGAPFASDTDQVPDASRITPMPVHPDTRAGHDISIEVNVDTGGPGITHLECPSHEVAIDYSRVAGTPKRANIKLKDKSTIPNRDFVLKWKPEAEGIEEATFTHASDIGKFFTLMIAPPERVDDTDAVPREIIFVLDVSGSMKGFPIEKAKETMSRIIDTLRPEDTFNIITFANGTSQLWPAARPFTEANRSEAQTFLASRSGGGGTEMMDAINAALVRAQGTERDLGMTPEAMANLPADGRALTIELDMRDIVCDESTDNQPAIRLDDGATILVRGVPAVAHSMGWTRLKLTGRWETKDRRRIFEVDSHKWLDPRKGQPVRFVCFMTDGKVGNDMVIIDAVKQNAETTRVFSFGIGNSVNRYLLESMALAGRGAVEFVLLEDQANPAVERFTQRIQTPVLTDIKLDFSDGLEVVSHTPRQIPDLFDQAPIIIHGRYEKAGKGTLTITGQSGEGPYERAIPLEFKDDQPDHDVIATLWARARVEDLMNEDLKAVQEGRYSEELKSEIIRLGEQYQIMTQFTSFVAVEKARVTIGGKPRLVHVPIELPAGTDWSGFFGGCSKATELFAQDDPKAIEDMMRTAIAPPTTAPAEAELPDDAVRIEVKNVEVSELADTLNNMVRVSRRPDSRSKDYAIKVTADHTTGSLIVQGSKSDREEIRQLLERLDVQEVSTPPTVQDVAVDSTGKPIAPEGERRRLKERTMSNHPPSHSGPGTPIQLEARGLGDVSVSMEQLIWGYELEMKADLRGVSPADSPAPQSSYRAHLGDDTIPPPQPPVERRLRAAQPDGDFGLKRAYRSKEVIQGASGSVVEYSLYPRTLDLGYDVNEAAGERARLGTSSPLLGESSGTRFSGQGYESRYGYYADRGRTRSGRLGETPDDAGVLFRSGGLGVAVGGSSGAGGYGGGYDGDGTAGYGSGYGGFTGDLLDGGRGFDAYGLEAGIGSEGVTQNRTLVAPQVDGAAGEVLSRDAKSIRRLYDVKGDPKAVAGELDKTLYGLIGYDAPIAKPSLYGNQILVSGELRYFEQVEDWLSRIEESATPSVAGAAEPTTPTTQPAEAEHLRYAPSRLPPFFRERTVLAIARLVDADDLEQARSIAELLASLDPYYEIGAKVQRVLSDVSLDATKRKEAVAALAEDAAEPIRGLIRQMTLGQRLDPRLYALFHDESLDAEKLQIEMTEHGPRVTVVVETLDKPTREALAAAGLNVESTADSLNLIVGTVSREQIDDIALVDAVRRVEPTEMK